MRMTSSEVDEVTETSSPSGCFRGGGRTNAGFFWLGLSASFEAQHA